MKNTLIASLIAGFGLLASQAYAANADCAAQATERKLAGAAKTSFLKKCEKDAAASAPAATAVSPACEKSAADKKLHGAAKKSHIKKCTADEAAAKK
jgi:hypothetical protein